MPVDVDIDAGSLYLSGGAANLSPAASLGGDLSSKLLQGMGVHTLSPVPSLIVEDVTGACGEGVATVAIVGDTARFTPPGGGPGGFATIAAGGRNVLLGADPAKAVRVFREAGLPWAGVATLRLLDVMHGVLAMGSIPDADRTAGETYYRAIFIKAQSAISAVSCWVTTAGQPTWSLAKELPVADAIQTIADELTAPTGVGWFPAVTPATALAVGDMVAGATMGIWLRRVFPVAGAVAPVEESTFNFEFEVI